MIDKQELFTDFKKRLSWDAREPRIAIRYDSDPQEQSEYWYLVDAQDGKGYQLHAVHDVFPVSKLEEEASRLVQKYGPFTQMGLTYEIQPFIIGSKRYGTKTQEELEILRRATYKRQNYKIMLFECGLQNLMDHEAANKETIEALEAEVAFSIDGMTDEEYAAMVDEFVKEELDYMTPIDLKSAERRALKFLSSNARHDKDIIEKGVEKDNQQRILFRKLDFGDLSL